MAQPMEREEQTYQKEGSLESQISKLEMRVLALECKDTPEAPEKPLEATTAPSGEALAKKLGGTLVEGDEGYTNPDLIPF